MSDTDATETEATAKASEVGGGGPGPGGWRVDKVSFSEQADEASTFKDKYAGDIFSIALDAKHNLAFICGYSCISPLVVDLDSRKPLGWV